MASLSELQSQSPFVVFCKHAWADRTTRWRDRIGRVGDFEPVGAERVGSAVFEALAEKFGLDEPTSILD